MYSDRSQIRFPGAGVGMESNFDGHREQFWGWWKCSVSFFFFLRFYLFIYLFLETGEGRERGKETSLHGYLLHTPHLGTWPTTQACALTGNQTNDPLVHRPTLNPLSHTSQGKVLYLDYNDGYLDYREKMLLRYINYSNSLKCTIKGTNKMGTFYCI